MSSRSKDPLPASVSRRSWFGPVLVLACVILPAGLLVLDAVQSYDRTLDESQRDLENTTRIFAENAHNKFETYKLALSLLDEHTSGLTWDQLQVSQPIHEYLAKLVQDYPQIGALAMIDPAGAIRVSTFLVTDPPPNFSDRGYFIELQHDVGTIVGERVDWGDKISIVQRRSTPDGRFDGVLAVNVEQSTAFLDFWQHAPANTVTAVVRKGGAVLARYPKPAVDLASIRFTGPMLDQAMAGMTTFANVVSPIDHIRRMMSFQQVHGFPFVLIHGATTEAILLPWRSALLRNVVRYGGVTAGLVLLALTVTYHNRCQARTLEELADRTRALTTEVIRREGAEAELEAVWFDIVERQEADRKRIAGALHDSLGQHVALLHLNVDAISRTPENVDHVRERASQQKVTATQISQELSRLAWELRPVWLDDMGLEPAIRTFISIMSERSGLRFSLDCSLGDRRFSTTVEATLYRALQESVTNIIKHAEATRVDILLDVSAGNIHLMIEDNGKGFPAPLLGSARSGPTLGGLGLRGVRERLAMVHGSLRIESEPGNGAALILDVPA